MMNTEQVKGLIERLVTIGITYAVGRGWVTSADAAPLITFGVVVISAGWGLYVNTHGSLSTAASNVAK